MAWIVATAAGCVVMPTGAYYRPSYPGAKPYSIMCGREGSFGATDSIRIPALAGVTVTVRTDSNPARAERPRLLAIRVHNPRGARIVPAPEPVMLENGGRSVRLDPSYTGPDGAWAIERDLDGVSGDFALRIPAMTIDGRVFAPEPIRFELRRRDWAIYPFNC